MQQLKCVLFLLIIMVFSCSNDNEMIMEDVSINELSVKRVYGDGSTYCAFTSLIKRDGIFYIAFREGMKHYGPGDYGVIRILKSSDLENWDLMTTITCNEVDLRDPCLSIRPDGKMHLVCGARILSKDTYITRTYVATEIRDGVFSEPTEAIFPNLPNSNVVRWLWRLTWNGQMGYGACYQLESSKDSYHLTLLSTKDGFSFQKVTDLKVQGSPSETRLRFDENNTMIALVRNDSKNIGYIGRSFYPYTEWDWKSLGVYVAGHDFVIDDDKMVLVTRMSYNGANRTAVFVGNLEGNFQLNQILQSGGDTSYCSIVDLDDEYVISYYAAINEAMPSIYIARISKIDISMD